MQYIYRNISRNLAAMIHSVARKLGPVAIPPYQGEIKMLPFDLGSQVEVPDGLKSLVRQMTAHLPLLNGTAYLTIDGRLVEAGQSQRRGGAHIDGNYFPKFSTWGSGGGNGWKVGEGGRAITSAEHLISYCSPTGGMLIASTYPACKGWVGAFVGQPATGGDCAHLTDLDSGFMLEADTLYYGSSQFVHESLPLDAAVHRTLARITLPHDYPLL